MFDKIQYNYPGAELEDKETDGELKLYPPIDDYSDEDVSIAPSSTNMRAKITFGNSSDTEQRKINVPLNIQNLQAQQAKDPVPIIPPKNKKPALQKTFEQEKKFEQVQKIQLPITMEGAQKFFIEDPDEKTSTENKPTYFDEYVADQSLIEKNLEKGVYFKGIVKTNPRFRRRAFVSVPELNIDVLI